ncbi:MAG: 5-formyltetrahydrofolate cyclo-ligase [Cellvibrionaceae bacterium]|nr:5-formyltetrahydrofolate cyclo-ligase [Cellvibrionaceae bacterium]
MPKRISEHEKKRLRRQLRQQRRDLSPAAQQQHADEAAEILLKSPLFTEADTIAAYIAGDGELDLSPVFDAAWYRGKHCYVPVVGEFQQMTFVPYERDTPTQFNRFGIAEPLEPGPAIAVDRLDLVLLPLVGFCRNGERLGMGGGYYDRAFSFKAGNPKLAPTLIGVAHSMQELNELQTDNWDIPLHGIVTNREYIRAQT